jgi:Flp pilus assembly pilin Flp
VVFLFAEAPSQEFLTGGAMKIKSPVKNQKGQALIEYLIIVALVGVGSIALMRAVSQNINARFANVVHALGGKVEGKRNASEVTSNMYRKRDLRDFVEGSLDAQDSKNKDHGN